ncbi:MAG: asparagine--tRNA ligase [Nanoarchaeota archaeon]|nr:asparagine--tRNA ligase [Nanoarchaeota archaeon]
MFVSIQDAIKKGKGKVSVRGWIYRERGSSKIKFIVLRDSSNIIQCILEKDKISDKEWENSQKLLIESSVEIEGTIKQDERAPTGYEINVTKLNVIHFAEKYPITKDQSTEFLLDNRHLWIRSRQLTAVMKIRSTVLESFREYFQKKNFYELSPPIFTPNACEGGSTLFEVKYYNDKVYLTQSWQLYAEAAIFGLEKIFTISPCFRAEKSKTSRHLSEFWMAEMEAAWYGLDELTKDAEEVITYTFEQVLKKNLNELKILNRDISKLKKVKTPFIRMTYKEALKALQKKGMKVKFGKDLRTIEEDKLVEGCDKPIIVTHYPKEIMAFYKPRDPEDKETARCFDVLAPEGYGELVGGSERDIDIEELKKYLKKEGANPDNYSWYFDTRRYGNVPHGGFGLGIERLVAWICGLPNIKDAIAFPRTMLRKTP